MAKERKAYAPFSLTSEAGVAQTPVEGYIDVRQEIYPTVNTGSINENGKWTGVKSDDTQFIGISKALAIPNSGNVVFPDTNNHPNIVMNGFRTDLINKILGFNPHINVKPYEIKIKKENVNRLDDLKENISRTSALWKSLYILALLVSSNCP